MCACGHIRTATERKKNHTRITQVHTVVIAIIAIRAHENMDCILVSDHVVHIAKEWECHSLVLLNECASVYGWVFFLTHLVGFACRVFILGIYFGTKNQQIERKIWCIFEPRVCIAGLDIYALHSVACVSVFVPYIIALYMDSHKSKPSMNMNLRMCTPKRYVFK